MTDQSRIAPRLAALLIVCVIASAVLSAHGVSSKDGRFLQSLNGAAIEPLMYLGAKHMVTGYDHLLFLVGVVFFLYRTRDLLLYVSLFTIGHSITLLAGALGGIRANPYIIDAIIGLSIVYKAFENMGARWRRWSTVRSGIIPLSTSSIRRSSCLARTTSSSTNTAWRKGRRCCIRGRRQPA